MKKQGLLLLGGVLLMIGLVLGFVPVSASGSSCGSAFVGSDQANIDDYTTVMTGGSLRDATHADDCAAARSMWRVPALALSIPGAALLLVGASAGGRREPSGAAKVRHPVDGP